jgi:hypothetical protein
MRAERFTTKDYLRIAALPPRELEWLVVRGDTPDPAALVGWEFRGTNAWPPLVTLLRIKKFIKGIYVDAAGDAWGYNMPVKQNGLAAAWTYKDPASPKRFGFYRVAPVDPGARDNAYLHAVLLDYGRGGNPVFDPSMVLRDYLVRVDKGSDELLIGKAYAAVGAARVSVGYFVLERQHATDWRR